MDSMEARKKIEAGQISPVYVLYGTEPFMMNELIDQLKQRLVATENLDFNYQSFDLSEQAVQEAVDAAETFPFLGEKRMVVATEAYFLTGAKLSSKVEHQLDRLEQYLSAPADYTVFVLVVQQEKLDERKKIVKLVKKLGALVACLPYKDEQLYSWLDRRAHQLDIQIESDAAALLIQFVGSNMQLLTKEMDKMASYVGKQGLVTPTVVQELIAKTSEQNVFQMVDHVVHFRLDQAFDILRELLKKNEEPIRILFLLARQFRIILKAKELSRQGYTQGQMGKAIGVHPYICKLAVEQGRNFSEEQLLSLFDQLAETDYMMKTGQMDKTLALEMFLLGMQKLGRGRSSPIIH